jgi:flagellar hook assembly protein FlgD
VIRYELPKPGHVDLRIYDAAGRLVQVLADGEVGAGMQGAVWRGRDRTGRAVSAGVYFCRLRAGPFEQTRRMTLVK